MWLILLMYIIQQEAKDVPCFFFFFFNRHLNESSCSGMLKEEFQMFAYFPILNKTSWEILNAF